MIPTETVVELLMENIPNKWMWTLHGRTIEAGEGEDLSDAVRDYLSTLVPKPVKLSECEEGLYFTGKYVPGISVMRDGEFAYEADGTCGGLAKDFEVIRPAEVK